MALYREILGSGRTQTSLLENEILTIFRHGASVAIVIFGRRDTGKTDHSFFIAETLQKFNQISHYATNAKVYKAPFEIEQINNMEDLETWASSLNGRKLFILDEAGKALRRRTPMSKLNIGMLDKLQTLRKYKLSLILIAPDEKYIDSASLGSDVLDAIIVKPEFKNRKKVLYHDILESRESAFDNVPGTSISFDTWDIAPFKLKAEITKDVFSDKELEVLRRYGNGETHKTLGLHKEQLRRIVIKFCKKYTDELQARSHKKALEVSYATNGHEIETKQHLFDNMLIVSNKDGET